MYICVCTVHLRVLEVPRHYKASFGAIISENTKYVARSYILAEVDDKSIITFIVENICLYIASKFWAQMYPVRKMVCILPLSSSP